MRIYNDGIACRRMFWEGIMEHIDSAYSRLAYERREEQWEHISYYNELGFLQHIKRGEPEKIEGRVRAVFPAHNGHLSSDPLRQAIYEFVACITLVTRFAVEGGVTMEYAYTLSDAYIKSVDTAKDVLSVHRLCQKMLIDFATKVKRAKAAQKPLSMPVIQAINYIDSRLHYHLSLEDIANAVGRSASYLSVLFKEEMGVPLSRYINSEKIEEARHLLRDTDMTICEIAETLAFGSQSYFTKLFREFTGETPKSWRVKRIVKHG